jgi:ADP-ribose/FAD diphosphatase
MQTYIFFRGSLAAPHTFSAGPESSDVQLFHPDDIPYDQLAFSSVYLTLRRWQADKSRGSYTLAHGVIRKRPGASYRDPNAFEYQESYEVTLNHDVIEKG